MCMRAPGKTIFSRQEPLRNHKRTKARGIVDHTEGITIEVEPTLEQETRKGQISDVKI
jgi:hypothetical protein